MVILNNLFGVDIMEEAVEICKLRLFLKLVAQVDPDTERDNFGIEPLPDIDFNIRTGNTLVGYATLNSVEKALSSKFDFDNAAEKIAAKAADLQQAFEAFRSSQIEGEGSVPPEDKLELSKRLQALGDELSRHLGGDYGIDHHKKDALTKWLRSHQPFHWCVEFFGIMNSGGFDVIIGNPPYVEYKDVKATYTVRGFRSEQCSDLYAFCTERALALLRLRSRLGLIVPISMFCTDGFEALQRLSLSSLERLWLSFFSNRPSQLFDGAQKRLTILLGLRSAAGEATVFTTQYLRWRREEFGGLFRSRLQYAPPHPNFSVFPASLEKLGSGLEVRAFSRIASARETLAGAVRRATPSRVYYTRKFGYFLAFLDFIPRITDVATGRTLPPSELKDLGLSSHESVTAVVAALSSSTFFWFWNVLSDCRNLNRRDLLAFAFDPERVEPQFRRLIADLRRRYLTELRRTSRTMLKSGLRIETFDYAACKPTIDEIDRSLARHYGLSEEELDFIVNYDIKYRVDLGAEGGEDDHN